MLKLIVIFGAISFFLSYTKNI